MCNRVLRRGVNIAQSPLQRRGLVECATTAEREARIGYTNAGGRDPCRGLLALYDERLVLQRSGKGMAPMTCCLDLEQRPRRSQVSGDSAEFALECFRLPHRHRAPQLLPAGISKRNEF